MLTEGMMLAFASQLIARNNERMKYIARKDKGMNWIKWKGEEP
jgi:hypothetical protein